MQVDNPVLNSAVAALESGEQPHLVTYVDRIVDYCVENENGKVFEDWDRETLRQLVAYHQAKGTIIALSDNENNIQGVFMWYNCNEDDQWREQYRRIAERYVTQDGAEAYIQNTIDQPRGLFSVSLKNSKVTSWRMPIQDEHGMGIWHKRYYVPGTDF